MKALLLAIGKTDNPYLTTAIEDYLTRASHYAPLELRVIPDVRDARNLTREHIPEPIGLAVLDASFISANPLLPPLLPVLGHFPGKDASLPLQPVAQAQGVPAQGLGDKKRLAHPGRHPI